MEEVNENKIHHRGKTSLLRRLLRYLKPYLGKFILAFILMIITSFTSLILPFVSGLAIDVMVDPSLTLEGKTRIVIVSAIVLLAVSLVSVIISYFQNMMLQKIGQKVTDQIRIEVFTHIETLTASQLNEMPVGKLVTRATNDPANISEMFTNTIVNLVRNFLMMLVIAGMLFYIHPTMALVTLIALPFIIGATLLFNKFSRKAYRAVRNEITIMNSFLSENLSGMKITQIFNQEEKKEKEFLAINRKLEKKHRQEINLFAVYRPLVYLLASLATVIAVYFGVVSILNGVITAGLFVAFYVYIGQFYEPIQQISEQFNALQNGFASAEKIFDILDTKPTIVDEEDALELETFTGHIEFKNVWFQYIAEEWILKGVSFEVLPNETIAFVGATGSGKTTILQLLVRNYEVNSGEILFDGINIKRIKRSSLRAFIGQMLQDVFLFSGTIRDNITFGNPLITNQDIEEASRYVGLNHVLKKTEHGLDEVVKERGNNFSSGERQLISFARALVYKPTLMILDEATASIDSETEAIIQESLNKMMSISTMIIVAHRLSTIQHSDKIFVMQKGEIIEAGTHQELLENKGHYYTLYQIQYDQDTKIQSE